MLAAALLAATLAFAGDAAPVYQPPVLVKAIGFTARHSGGRVLTAWRKYKRADFAFYKVVRSTTLHDPVFPENGEVFSTSKPYVTSFADLKVDPGVWYYRLCVVTRDGARWVSPVVEVLVSRDASSPSVPGPKDFE